VDAVDSLEVAACAPASGSVAGTYRMVMVGASADDAASGEARAALLETERLLEERGTTERSLLHRVQDDFAGMGEDHLRRALPPRDEAARRSHWHSGSSGWSSWSLV